MRFWGTEGQKLNYDPDLRDVDCDDLYLENFNLAKIMV
jgi:hypothetical protein